MNVTWIDLVGYTALAINLFSMSQANVKNLRWLSLTANAIYIFYGVLLSAMPLIIGCSIAVCLHGYRLYKLHQNK